MFTPEYGDTVPSLIMGAAGMTYEKGSNEVYGKQVYDHYLAIDTTLNLTSDDKVNSSNWVRQWGEAVDQGQACALQPNKLVSPLHDTIKQQPKGTVCGYFFKPGQHTADRRRCSSAPEDGREGLHARHAGRRQRLPRVRQLDGRRHAAAVNGQTLPAGTFCIPMAQGMKHWIQAVLGENPFIPYDYYYDVVTWSYPLQRGLAGSGFLTTPMSPGVQMTALPENANFGTVPAGVSAVYAFNTDSARGLGAGDRPARQGRQRLPLGARASPPAGKQFYSGAALVDGASLAASGVNLNDAGRRSATPR